jgi:hypothetical protein
MNGQPVGVSLRLVQVLRTYCGGLQPGGLRDLRSGLRAGQYPWLHDELAAAMRQSGGSWWATALGGAGGAGLRAVRAEQRQVWRSLFPGEPFPPGR